MSERWCPSGGRSSSTRIVIRIATTPSVNAIIRSGRIARLCHFVLRWPWRILRVDLGWRQGSLRRGPLFRDRTGVELLDSIQRSCRPFRSLPSERAGEHPLARQLDQAEPVVGEIRSSLGVEVEVDRELLDERRIVGSTGLLETVGDERGDHLELARAGTNGDR